MGLAILPPRLKQELKQVEQFLLGEDCQVATYHQEWANQLKTQNPNISAETVEDVVQASVGQIFSRVLEDAGVYKRTEEGQEAFLRFVQSVGIQP